MFFASAILPLGWALGVLAVAMLVPSLVAFGYDEIDQSEVFLLSALLTAFTSGAIIIATRGVALKAPRRREGFFSAILIWTLLPAFGALPLYQIGVAQTGVDAWFEAVSGFTTTGATVLQQLDITEKSVLIWRALLQWLGGMATIVLVVVLLSYLGGGGMQFFQSAMPRGERNAISVQVLHTLKSIGGIYVLLTLLCVVLLWLVGMPVFEAFAHAFSAISGGGFSTRDASIDAFSNQLIELVLIIFMIASAVNFTLHWAVIHGRKPSIYFEDVEIRVLAGLIVAGGITLTAVAWGSDSLDRDHMLSGLFMAVSAVTTSGFVTGTSSHWPVAGSLLVLMLAFTGGAAGSTAGGLKLLRLTALIKMAGREVKRLAHPHGVVALKYGDRAIDTETLHAIWSYFCIYLLTIVGLAFVLALFGVEFADASGLVVAAISNAGFGDGTLLTSNVAGYAALSVGAKISLIVAMILGRLELLTVLVLISPAFWRR
jgi:trk system potassium uptake protein